MFRLIPWLLTTHAELKGAVWTSNQGFFNAPTSTFSGLTQLGAREYDSTLGKFLSVGPVLATDNPLQNNGYAYAANSPISNTDATGQCYVGSSDSLGADQLRWRSRQHHSDADVGASAEVCESAPGRQWARIRRGRQRIASRIYQSESCRV